MSRARGLNLRLLRNQVIDRAFDNMRAVPKPPPGAPADAGHRPINYRLNDYNGGKDPLAFTCNEWSYGDRTPTSDCIGFVLHSAGLDRKQPGYHGSRGEDLNCAALMDDAESASPVFVRLVSAMERVLPGDFLLTRDHIALIIRPAPEPNPQGVEHLVIDCSPRHQRNGQAINTGGPWSDACVVVRPLFYGEP